MNKRGDLYLNRARFFPLAAVVVLVSALPAIALAQTTPADSASATSDNIASQDLQGIVVTATPTFGGLKKLDAAFSITSLSHGAIKEKKHA